VGNGGALSGHFRASRKGVQIELSPEEKVFLAGMLQMLVELPKEGEDPASKRLRVPVYLDDQEANAEWWRLMGGELDSTRQSDRHVFKRVVDSPSAIRLTDEDADAFLRVLNEGRLALGARFRLEVEEDHDNLPEDQRQILDFLGWLLEELTTELSRSL
jgi:Domain of unknown function (DUF2017)